MSARRRLFLIPIAGLVAALLWTTVGSFSSASGQEDGQTGVIERAHRGALRPSFDEPIFILVLGTDARLDNPATSRNDSIHIVGIDPKRLRASIVGIPRDALVQIPGRGSDKAGHALFFADVDGAVKTFEDLSGCRFDYRMITGFQGFAGVGYRQGKNSEGGLINDIGGVTLDIPAPGLADTAALGKNLDPIPPGKQVLNGPQALAWARSRKDTALRPRGDFDRSLAQGTLMVAILRELRGDFAKDPATALRALAAARRAVRMNIGVTEGLQLGLLALQIQPKNVSNIVVDGEIGSHPSAGSVVRVTSRGLAQLADVCADGVLDSR